MAIGCNPAFSGSQKGELYSLLWKRAQTFFTVPILSDQLGLDAISNFKCKHCSHGLSAWIIPQVNKEESFLCLKHQIW
jgi:hypothetical protein